MIFAAILAGGSGTRMGGGLPKQFLKVGGVPIIVRSVRAFLGCGGAFDGIYAAVSAEHIEYTKALLAEYGCTGVKVIAGGSDRAGSLDCVINAVLSDGGSGDDILISHDAARPFVSCDIIMRNIGDTLRCGCAGTGVQATDTIFRTVDGERIESMPPRTEMYQMQTPQGFRIGEYRECFDSLTAEEKAAVTDACGVFLRCGREVFITGGDAVNIKLTRPIDLATGEFIAAQQDGKKDDAK